MNNKNVKNIIIDRIENIKKTNDLSNWSEDIGSFLDAYCTHPALAPAFAEIHTRKLKEYKPFFLAYQGFIDELSHLLQRLRDQLQHIDNLPAFPWQLVKDTPSSKNLDDPFYQPEVRFSEACKTLRSFFRELIECLPIRRVKVSMNTISLLTRYLDISTRIDYKHTFAEDPSEKAPSESFLCRKHFNFEGKAAYNVYKPTLVLEFKSNIFHAASSQATALAYNKSAALWKKLDNLKKWIAWTADGIHPENLSSKHSLFQFLQIEDAVNGFANYLLDYLVKDEELPEPSKKILPEPTDLPQIRSLSIFPYRTSDIDSYAFWIIAFHPDGTSTPYYVRKINDGSETHKFIATLLSLQNGDIISLEDASSSRAELSLTKEVGKVFFHRSGRKRTAFRGFHIFINDVPEKIDMVGLQIQLNRLNKQQDIPKFPQEAHQTFLSERVFKSQIPTSSDVIK